jgi:hypothetical protein
MEPNSLTEAEAPPDRRLSTLIDQARCSRDAASSVREPGRAEADRVFSDIAAAVERGLRTLDPGSADAGFLDRLRDTLKRR